MASGGYPGDYEKGREIHGIEAAETDPGVTVFQAGTRQIDTRLVTSGGRVLGVTALAPDLRSARDKAYAAVEKISFEGAHYRRDIAARGMKA
jgi:phosphoribosylamine--glycine ligase